MAFGRRRGRFGRRGFRRGPRRVGNYELLLTDSNNAIVGGVGFTDASTPSRVLTFQNGAFPDPQFALQQIANLEEPPQVGGAGGSTQTVRVDESGGFTAVVPLWDTALANQYDHNASLRALRGYLLPIHLRLTQANEPIGTGIVCRVRMELLPLDVSEEFSLFGSSLLGSSIAPYISFSRAGNRKRIWWRREWYMGINNTESFVYWNNDQPTPAGAGEKVFAEPRFSPIVGGIGVNLKNLMRIKRERWPVLAISVAGNWPAGSTSNVPTTNLMTLNGTLGQEVVMSLDYTGYLRSYIQK